MACVPSSKVDCKTKRAGCASKENMHGFCAQVLLLVWGYDTTPTHPVCEYFAGAAQISAAFRDAGHPVASYDFLYHEPHERHMDFLSPGGFSSLGFAQICAV